MRFENRNLAVSIILSLVTCGIYGLYWFYTIARDFEAANTQSRIGISPGVVLLLDIVTGNIFGIYAYYKWGKQTYEVASALGMPAEDKSTLYLVLGIFIPIVAMALIQNDFNTWSSRTAA